MKLNMVLSKHKEKNRKILKEMLINRAEKFINLILTTDCLLLFP